MTLQKELKKMKASDLIALKLSKYTDFVFSGQGGSVVHICDSIYKRKDIKLIPSQNEQGASLAADAYTRTSGKLGVVVTTSGPGTINALQGLACSYYDSIPALYFSGAPVLGALKKNKNLRQLGFQEMEMQEIVKSFTKYSSNQNIQVFHFSVLKSSISEGLEQKVKRSTNKIKSILILMFTILN